MAKTRIIIVEDHTILREGLRALLALNPDFEVCGEAQDGSEAMRLAEVLKPDLMLVDLSMPRVNGIDAIREVKRAHPEVKILALTVHKTEEYVLAAFDAGAEGYILKDATHTELLAAIGSILKGNRYVSPAISESVIRGYLEGKKARTPASLWETISSRERQILKLIAEGYKNKEIADILCISVKTAEKYRANLMKKLDLHSVSALTAYALEKGLVEK